MYIEDQINAMHQHKTETPFGWLICFEDRPLQGIPPKGDGPHMLFFSEESKAQAFIAARKAFLERNHSLWSELTPRIRLNLWH